jgi:hypothetical protein
VIAIISSTADLAFTGNSNTAALLALLQGFSKESNTLVCRQVPDSIALVGKDETIKKGLENFVIKLVDKNVKSIGWDFHKGEDERCRKGSWLAPQFSIVTLSKLIRLILLCIARSSLTVSRRRASDYSTLELRTARPTN